MEEQLESLLRGGQVNSLIDQQAVNIREKYGLKRVDIEVLHYLARNPEKNTARDIRRSLRINKGYVSQIMDHLGKRGFIIASPDQHDRRYTHYLVSEKTKEIVDETNRMWDSVGRIVFNGVTEEEQKVFRTVISKIEKNIMEMSD